MDHTEDREDKESLPWMKSNATPGSRPHSLVNWNTVCRPKELGGLAIFDIAKFGHAMMLRWPWYAWTDPSRPCHGTTLPCNAVDMELFRASTEVSIGDGACCLFWHDRWQPRGAPKWRFPELLAITTRRNRAVQKELTNMNWMRALIHLSTAA